MSTTATFEHAATTTAKAPRKSFFQRIIEARTRQGAAHVRAAFERMSDKQLADIGFNGDHIRHIRKSGTIPASYWA